MSRAEADMTSSYPKKFRLSGYIELKYMDFSSEADVAGGRVQDSSSTFIQKYSLGLRGYIYDPRLVTFSTRVTYSENRTKSGVEQVSRNMSRDFNYDLYATFLPLRPISLSVTALKTDAMTESAEFAPIAVSTLSYGATLKIGLRNRPLVKLVYNHFETSSENGADETKGDWFDLDVRGRINEIRTRYFLLLSYVDVSTNGSEERSYSLNLDSDTSFKAGHLMRTGFTYTDSGASNFMRFSTDLEFNPLKRFRHKYGYVFEHSEEDISNSSVHSTSGRWTYKISDKLNVGASLRFGMGKEESGTSEVSGWSYAASSNISYHLLPAAFSLRASYVLAHSGIRDVISDEDGDVTDNRSQTYHNLGLSASTRKLRFATVFAKYDLFVFDSDDESSLAHSFSVGLAGKGPGRAHWKLSADAQFSKATVELLDHETDETVVINGNSYALRAEVGYPFQKGGSVNLSGGYTSSQDDGINTKGYYYDLRVSRRIVKNLTFAAWWRETQNRIAETGDDSHLREFYMKLFYRIGKTYLNVDFRYFIQTNTLSSSRARSVIFTLKRYL